MGVGVLALRWVERERLPMGASQQGYLNIMVNDRTKTFNYTLTLMALHKSNGLWVQTIQNVTAGEGVGGAFAHSETIRAHVGLAGIEWNSECVQNVGFRLVFVYLNPLGVLQVINGVFTGVVNYG